MQDELVRRCKCGVEIHKSQVEIVSFVNNTKHYRAKCVGCQNYIYLKARDVEKKRKRVSSITYRDLEEFESQWMSKDPSERDEILLGLAEHSRFFLSLYKQHLDRGLLSKKQLACVSEALHHDNARPFKIHNTVNEN